MVALVPAGADQRELVGSLVSAYLLELLGTADYPHLERYWEDDDRLPFLILDADDVAGFCLIRVLEDGWNIAEFGVLPTARRGGVGRAAVEDLARRARGAGAGFLQAKVHPDNMKALPFWLACGFTEVPSDTVTTTRRAL